MEPGSSIIKEVYSNVLDGKATLSFSAWNIGEVFGVLKSYFSRGWLDRKMYETVLVSYIGETLKLIRIGLVKIIPVKTSLIINTWNLIEKYQIYEADALQLVSARSVSAEQFLSGDKKLVEISKAEGLKALYLG
ncbi:MAG: type II toxin-antitoxin system VapC family toxin [Nitrososphaerales archaeon]